MRLTWKDPVLKVDHGTDPFSDRSSFRIVLFTLINVIKRTKLLQHRVPMQPSPRLKQSKPYQPAPPLHEPTGKSLSMVLADVMGDVGTDRESPGGVV